MTQAAEQANYELKAEKLQNNHCYIADLVGDIHQIVL
jgi:hypothetical protein